MADKLKIPKFASEAEEAQWWYDHREELTKAFEDAAARGELHTGSRARLARERAAGAEQPHGGRGAGGCPRRAGPPVVGRGCHP